MCVIDTSGKEKVIAVAENGVPVTGAMVDEWCSAYDKGKLPKGYVTDGIETVGRGTEWQH